MKKLQIFLNNLIRGRNLLCSWYACYRNSFTFQVLFWITLAGIAVFLLYPGRDRDTQGRQDIVLWVPRAAGDQVKACVEEFELRYPQYRVRIGSATVRDSVGDPTRFLLGVAGGVPPDLIHFDRFAIVEWAGRGAFHPLNDFLEREKGKADAIRRENYVSAAWEEVEYRGNLYAVPDSVDTRALYYDRDALLRAGLVYKPEDPAVRSGIARAGEVRPPATWEELCRKRLDLTASVAADGSITFDTPLDGSRNRIQENDVICLFSRQNQSRIFRARIGKIRDSRTVQVDFRRELPPGVNRIPEAFLGRNRIKVFDRDSYVVRLTRFDEENGTMKTAGFLPLFGNSWLYLYGWLNGGEFMSADGTRCTLDEPRVVSALEYITDVYDCMGGMEEARIFQMSGLGSSMLDLFLSRRIAMKIDGSWFMKTICAYKPELNFGIAPPPLPEKRRNAGAQSLTWMGGWAYAIPATAKNKEGAWLLLKWLCSPESDRIGTGFASSAANSKGQVYLPELSADIRFNRRRCEEYVKNSIFLSENLKQAYTAFLATLKSSRFRPVTPVGQKLWNEQSRATELATGHAMSAQEALSHGRTRVQNALDKILQPPAGGRIAWHTLIGIYVLCLAGGGVFLFCRSRKREQKSLLHHRWFAGYLCISPWLIGFLTFGAGGFLFSIIISFSSNDILSPARFTGLENYRNLFSDPIFWLSIRNTCFMILSVPLGIAVGIGLALLLNHSLKGIRLYRTLFYLPAVVPMVAALLLWMKIFDPNIGFLNQFLRALGVEEPPSWLTSPVWAKPSIIIMGLWNVGGSMVIWLAGLKNIPESLYEAAAMDGAGAFSRFRHITLPLLTPYIFFNLIMGMIGVFQIFEQAYIMTSGGPEDATLFYAYKLFNEAFRYLNFGTAGAMAWMMFLVILAITWINFLLGKKWVHYGD